MAPRQEAGTAMGCADGRARGSATATPVTLGLARPGGCSGAGTAGARRAARSALPRGAARRGSRGRHRPTAPHSAVLQAALCLGPSRTLRLGNRPRLRGRTPEGAPPWSGTRTHTRPCQGARRRARGAGRRAGRWVRDTIRCTSVSGSCRCSFPRVAARPCAAPPAAGTTNGLAMRARPCAQALACGTVQPTHHATGRTFSHLLPGGSRRRAAARLGWGTAGAQQAAWARRDRSRRRPATRPPASQRSTGWRYSCGRPRMRPGRQPTGHLRRTKSAK